MLIKFIIFSAERMTISVYSNTDLDSLEKMVTDNFQDVENKSIGQISYKTYVPAYRKQDLSKIVKIKTDKLMNKMTMCFILPPFLDQYRSNPLDIIGSMVGYEGKDSLLSCLIQEKLALELSSYPYNYCDYFTGFYIDIKLTKAGMESHERVMEIVFQYLAILGQQELSQRLFEEIRKLKNIDFTFKNKENGLGKALNCALNLTDYPPELVNVVDYLMEEYKPDEFAKALKLLKPESLLVMLKSDGFQNLDEKDKYFDTEFSRTDIDENKMLVLNQILEGKHLIKGIHIDEYNYLLTDL